MTDYSGRKTRDSCMIHGVPAGARGPSPDGQDQTAAHLLPDGPHRQGRVGDFVANTNLIVAMAYGRAGSLLIQSLFDSHPNVLTLPYLGAMYSLIPASINDLDWQIDWFIKRFPEIFATSRGGYFCKLNDHVAAKFGPDGDEDLRVNSMEFQKQLLGVVNEYYTIDRNRRLSRKEFCAPWKGAISQWELNPPGNYRNVFAKLMLRRHRSTLESAFHGILTTHNFAPALVGLHFLMMEVRPCLINYFPARAL